MTDTAKPKYLYGWTDQNASPITLYTDSTVLTLGMPLYDNTGVDTGLTVDIINQDGTFDVNSGPLYYCYTYPAGDGPGYVFLNSYPKVNEIMDVYSSRGSTLIKPTSSDELNVLYSNCTVTSVTDTSVRLLITIPPYGSSEENFTRDVSSDLYT